MKPSIAAFCALAAAASLAGGDPARAIPESGTSIRVAGNLEAAASWNAKKGKMAQRRE